MGQVLAEHSGLKLQSFNGFTTHKPRCHLLPEMLWHTKLIKEGCECRSCSLFFLWEPVSLLYLVSGFRSSQWQDRTGQAGRDPGRTGERRKGDVWIFSDKIFPEKKKKKSWAGCEEYQVNTLGSLQAWQTQLPTKFNYFICRGVSLWQTLLPLVLTVLLKNDWRCEKKR